jgi:hypothetical protein
MSSSLPAVDLQWKTTIDLDASENEDFRKLPQLSDPRPEGTSDDSTPNMTGRGTSDMNALANDGRDSRRDFL